MGQLKLTAILKEINKEVSYAKPNFDFEWPEAQRYPEFQDMGKVGWIKKASEGYPVKYSEIQKVLGNVDLEFDTLHKDKQARFQSAYKSGKIEMPIAVKFSHTDYDLVAGNTRLSGLVNNGIDPTIWVVDLSQ
jgi:hypothetical protein